MNNEPVAWMARNELLFSVVKDEIHYIPLYTHPVKELTDDEIADLIKATNDETGFRHMRIFDFVKILLRKEREK